MVEYQTLLASVVFSGIVALFVAEFRIRRNQMIERKEDIQEWRNEVSDVLIEVLHFCNRKSVSNEVDVSEVADKLRRLDKRLYKLKFNCPKYVGEDVRMELSSVSGCLSIYAELCSAMDVEDPVEGFGQVKKSYENLDNDRYYQDVIDSDIDQGLSESIKQLEEMQLLFIMLPSEYRENIWNKYREEKIRTWLLDIAEEVREFEFR